MEKDTRVVRADLQSALSELGDFKSPHSFQSDCKSDWTKKARAEEANPARILAGNFYGVWKNEDYPELSADEMAKEIKESRQFKKDKMTLPSGRICNPTCVSLGILNPRVPFKRIANPLER